MKMAQSFPNGKKTLSEKEKLLVTSNFSFSHSVFKILVLKTRENQGLFGKGLNNKILDQSKLKAFSPFPNKAFKRPGLLKLKIV